MDAVVTLKDLTRHPGCQEDHQVYAKVEAKGYVQRRTPYV